MVGKTKFDMYAGGVTRDSDFYGPGGSGLTNVGITAAQEIVVTETFSVPVSVSYIVNPRSERAFLVFALRLSP